MRTSKDLSHQKLGTANRVTFRAKGKGFAAVTFDYPIMLIVNETPRLRRTTMLVTALFCLQENRTPHHVRLEMRLNLLVVVQLNVSFA